MQLHELKAPKGSRKKKRIVGRGRGSGRGKTSTRGQDGQSSRTGRGTVTSSEGGQMPLIRRLPKVGFRSARPILNQVVKLEDVDKKFSKGEVVNGEALKAKGLIKNFHKSFKVLANGEITKALTFKVNTISVAAKEKIEKAGGKVESVKKDTVNRSEKILKIKK
jgi:large subunit ribosomal protein L15